MPTLGFIEIPSLSIAAVIADKMAKAARILILGFEASGNENILIRVSGGISDVNSALAAGEQLAIHYGSSAVLRSIAQPAEGMHAIVYFPNMQNPLYGGRDQLLPTDFPKSKNKFMTNKQEALGILETQGLTAILEATDTMLKSANISLVGKEKIGAAYVTVIVRGDVAAVTTAVDAGSKAIGSLGKLIAAHVIARPHEELLALLPK